MPMSTPQNYYCQCLCPHSELPPPPQETLQYQQVGLTQAFMKSLIFSLDPDVHKTFCAPSMSVVSVSPSPVEFL